MHLHSFIIFLYHVVLPAKDVTLLLVVYVSFWHAFVCR